MPIEFWYVLARANTLFTFTTRIQIQNPEAATAAKPLAQIQKTNPAAAEKLKAFLNTKGLDDSKVGYLPPLFTPFTRNEDMSVVGRARGRQNPRDCACRSMSTAP